MGEATARAEHEASPFPEEEAGLLNCDDSDLLAATVLDGGLWMLHLFNGKVEPGEIANLPSYNFYAKLSGGLEPQDPVRV